MKKILTFIIKKEKILLLLGSNEDPQFHKSFWYTVTGSYEEDDESLIQTVRREVKEETNLNLTQIIDLNWIFKYESLGNDCTEYAFVSYTNDEKVVLNEESIDYKWCDIDEFIKLIKWYYDKDELYERLKKYVNRS